MTKKLFLQIFVVAALTALAIFMIIRPSRIDVEPVTQAQVDEAMAFLRSTLISPRYTYFDFINERSHLRGTTPSFEYTANIDTVISRGEYATAYITVPADGLYFFALSYELPPGTLNPLNVSLWVNGERQFEEAANIHLPTFWEDESKDFPLNRFGDEIAPVKRPIPGEHRVEIFDAGFASDLPLLFHLQAGVNAISLRNETSWELRIAQLSVYSERTPAPFTPTEALPYPGLVTVNAIYYTRKNSTFIQMYGIRNAALEPFHPVDRRMNILSMAWVGDEVFFQVDVPQDGYYAVSIHCITANDDFSTFITVRINGEIPFAEAASFPLLPYGDERWRNQTLTDADGNPLLFFLTAGSHEMSIRLELAPLARQMDQLRLLIDHINQFSLDIRRVTGREIDRNRTWRLTRYIPEVDAFLEAYEIIYRDLIHELAQFSPRRANSGAANNMITALALLERLRERPDELPLHIDVLIGENASVLQMAGVSMDSLMGVGLFINNIYIGRADNLPRERAPWYVTLWAGAQNLWASYTTDKFVVRNRDEAINIWANHSFLHVDILQRMADTRFTPETGIEVNISVMPDVNRLIMSRAAGTNPDIALGVPAHMPFELGARGALLDLTQFDDFWQFMGDFVPGAMVPYIFNDGVYAIPETVSFAATVYRTDILGPLGLEAPDTWEDVASMQAVLQRFDMSFFKPIASGVGYKWFFQTTPLIYQHGALLYDPSGLSTAINHPDAVEALTFLGDLFTTFALAEQVPMFFNSFRFGQTPVGIMDASTYMLLLYAAPELLGQWNIAPFPGTVQDDGEISRWFIANGVGAFIFEDTDMSEEAWQFLQWYLSEEIQTEFAVSLYAMYRILWLSSNINALQNAPIDYAHMRIILDSMQWLRDVPRSPGQYMLERRISDIWNTMVFDGTPAQVAIDLRVHDINREFTRKMTEFGFLDAAGNQIRPYAVRELDWVIEMIEQAR